jgi:hypothetical protein
MESLKVLGARAANLGHDPDPQAVLKYLEKQAEELGDDPTIGDPLAVACKREERVREGFAVAERPPVASWVPAMAERVSSGDVFGRARKRKRET